MLFVVLFSLLLIVSCFVVSYFGKNWNLKVFLVFSSGVLLSLCFLDFLPHSFSGYNGTHHNHGLSFLNSPHLFILAGILVQALADIYLLPYLSFMDRFLEKDSKTESHHLHSHVFSPFSVCSVSGCLSICSFFDGIRLFTAVQVENFMAFSTAFGLFFHLLSEGVLISSLALSSGFKKRVLFVLLASLVGTLILGAFTASLFSIQFSLNNLVAFSTGCLIYICFVHLLPFSLKSSSRPWFFVGLILFSALHFVI